MTDTVKPTSVLMLGLRLGGGFVLGLFGAGLAAGVIASTHAQGHIIARGAVALGGAALAIAVAAWLILSTRNHWPDMPRSPRVRRSRIALYVSIGVSLAVGIAAGIVGQMQADHADPAHGFAAMFGSSPITTPLAAAVLAGWLVAMALSLYWHLTLDEIERAE